MNFDQPPQNTNKSPAEDDGAVEKEHKPLPHEKLSTMVKKVTTRIDSLLRGKGYGESEIKQITSIILKVITNSPDAEEAGWTIADINTSHKFSGQILPDKILEGVFKASLGGWIYNSKSIREYYEGKKENKQI